jgi:hypothetical protein
MLRWWGLLIEYQIMSDSSEWLQDIEGNFPLHRSIVSGKQAIYFSCSEPSSRPAAIPKDTTVQSAESWGVSAWTKTAKVTVSLQDGSPKRYFLKVNLSAS